MPSFEAELLGAQAIARHAGHHILRERQNLEISIKGHNDLVTNVDRSTERLIVDYLERTFPGDRIVGEEFGVQKTSEQTNARRSWFIDPIDGTVNFTTNVPLFCVSIGFQVEGETVVGAIFDPSRDELFSAALGDGARINGQPLQVSDADQISEAVLVTGFPYEQSDEFDWTMNQFDWMTRNSRGIRRLGSAALNLAYVASGRLDGFWQYGLQSWDTAAGYLMVTEAGGAVTDLQGAPYSVDAPSLLATNGHLHDLLIEQLQSLH